MPTKRYTLYINDFDRAEEERKRNEGLEFSFSRRAKDLSELRLSRGSVRISIYVYSPSNSFFFYFIFPRKTKLAKGGGNWQMGVRVAYCRLQIYIYNNGHMCCVIDNFREK